LFLSSFSWKFEDDQFTGTSRPRVQTASAIRNTSFRRSPQAGESSPQGSVPTPPGSATNRLFSAMRQSHILYHVSREFARVDEKAMMVYGLS
jgi:hypothetical protein